MDRDLVFVNANAGGHGAIGAVVLVAGEGDADAGLAVGGLAVDGLAGVRGFRRDLPQFEQDVFGPRIMEMEEAEFIRVLARLYSELIYKRLDGKDIGIGAEAA